MLQAFFHAWERRLAVGHHRSRRPPVRLGPRLDSGRTATAPRRGAAPTASAAGCRDVMADTDAFFTPPPTRDYTLSSAAHDGERLLTFPSAFADAASREQHRVTAATFRSARRREARRARRSSCCRSGTPTRTATSGLCRLLAWNGMSALRLSLPYHDQRMPPELHRADYIVSANVARTVQVCRQAVLDARRAIAWLAAQGYERIGILGTSLGSCLALLTTAHEPLIRARGAQSHLAVLRRRRLARALDASTCAKGSTATSSSICCARCGSRSARAGISSACAIGRRCSSTRGTT